MFFLTYWQKIQGSAFLQQSNNPHSGNINCQLSMRLKLSYALHQNLWEYLVLTPFYGQGA